jgi:hypothetical protein
MASFEIDLREFNLADVLHFLSRVKKTGVLKIIGDVSGEVYMKDGLVVHATNGAEKGIDALYNLSFEELQKASFESNVKVPEQTIAADFGKLYEDIEKRRIELQEIKKNLPPMDAVLAKSTKELETSVALRRTDWHILALIDGKRKVSDVIVASKVGGYEATKTVVWLKEQGLIYDPKEAERQTSRLVVYISALLKDFGKNGLKWLKQWERLSPENKRVIDALDIDETALSVAPRADIKPEISTIFFDTFENHMQSEGPKVYGKLLFKKKYEYFKQKFNAE